MPYRTSAPYQKGALEINHELIRRSIPKGTSLDYFTKNDFTKMIKQSLPFSSMYLRNRSYLLVYTDTGLVKVEVLP